MIFWPLKLALKIVGALFGAVVLYFAFGLAQIWMTGNHNATENANAILVFGTAENNGIPSPTLRGRLEHALLLYQEHRAPWVVVTGGRQVGDVYTEAEASATWLASHGVPRSRILEGAGNDTWQNVATSLPVMQAHGIRTVLTVSDPFHMYRADAICADQGLTPFSSPTLTSGVLPGIRWKYYLGEAARVAVGRIVGYQTLSGWTAQVPLFHPHQNHG